MEINNWALEIFLYKWFRVAFVCTLALHSLGVPIYSAVYISGTVASFVSFAAAMKEGIEGMKDGESPKEEEEKGEKGEEKGK